MGFLFFASLAISIWGVWLTCFSPADHPRVLVLLWIRCDCRHRRSTTTTWYFARRREGDGVHLQRCFVLRPGARILSRRNPETHRCEDPPRHPHRRHRVDLWLLHLHLRVWVPGDVLARVHLRLNRREGPGSWLVLRRLRGRRKRPARLPRRLPVSGRRRSRRIPLRRERQHEDLRRRN